jgi:acetyl-CoA carboxylase biotin carboxyl carrier protein
VVEIEKIRELVAMMVEHELTEMKLRDGEQSVIIKRGSAPQAPPVVTVLPAAAPAVPAAAAGAAATPLAAEAGGRPEDGLLTIRSPMVGTFYASSDPDASPYVTIGSPIEPDTIVCIIEAMKVFNEIKAEVAGTIEQVLVRNEQAVEFGQPLFLVRPKP